ncbi:MAG: ABC transporter permease [Acutalibacter sp.]|jgi:ABC-2 type transport system permease protein
MGNLLAAGMYRLARSKILYAGMLIMAATEVLFLFNVSDSAITEGMESQNFFGFTEMLPFVSAAFCGLLLGADYPNGTLRSQLICGHTKAQIYLSNLVLSLFAGICFYGASIATGLVYGLADGRVFTSSAGELFGYFLCSLLTTLASASLAAMIATLSSNRSLGIVANLLLAFVLLCCAGFLSTPMDQAETIPQFMPQELENGITIYTADPSLPLVPNPDYPQGIYRAILEFFWNFLPSGQGMQLASAQVESFWVLGLFSVVFLAVATLLGLAVFQRKDIK